MMPESATEIVAAITKIFVNLPMQDDIGYRDRDWTKQVMAQIGDLGREHDWEVCAGGFPGRFNGGWLYDLAWYRNEPRGATAGNLAEVFLVLECEWDKNLRSIKYDFEKLLLAKATLKVMVFQVHKGNAEAYLTELEKGIRVFRRCDKTETYILAAFDNSTHRFDVHLCNSSSIGMQVTADDGSGPAKVVE